jgi:uncharacterized protein YxeA
MEILLLIIIVIIVLICAAVIFYATVYNKFQDYIIRINEVEALIDTNLRNKYDLINRAIPIVKSNIDKDRNVFEDIVKLRSRKIGNFELYRILTRASNELNGLKTEFPDIEKSVCIIANRHIHINTRDKKDFYEDQIVSVKINNNIINNVHIKIADNFALALHINKDDAQNNNIESGDIALFKED